MIKVYIAERKKLSGRDVAATLPPDTVWVDMLSPTEEEEGFIEKALELEVPTREEMAEIETSSRLYKEGEALFMTASLLSRTDTDSPALNPVTFVLVGCTLITIRYNDPKTFPIFASRAQRSGDYSGGEDVLVGLLEAIIERLADIIEQVSNDVDAISGEVFANKDRPRQAEGLKAILQNIGQKGDMNSKSRESLVTLARLLTFLSNSLDSSRAVTKDLKGRIRILLQDTHSLTDYSSFQSNKINFLLDATLGLVNIEQNAIIKIFSVAAVVFLPPTLIASIYGMNFDFMPELEWPLGYPFALVLMVLSAIFPFWYFKWRKWL